jgi:hypothetical protein
LSRSDQPRRKTQSRTLDEKLDLAQSPDRSLTQNEYQDQPQEGKTRAAVDRREQRKSLAKSNLEHRKTKTNPFSAAFARVGKASRARREKNRSLPHLIHRRAERGTSETDPCTRGSSAERERKNPWRSNRRPAKSKNTKRRQRQKPNRKTDHRRLP